MEAAAEQTTEAFVLAATASPVEQSKIPTIKDSVPITLFAAPFVGGIVQIEAPMRAIQQGVVFSARYLAAEGARRVLMHCVAVERGARDKVQARVLSEPGSSSERTDQRTSVRIDAVSRMLRSASASTGRAVPVTVTDVSLAGCGIESRLEMTPGDVLTLRRPDGPEIAYIVVRRDLQNRDRYGLKALDATQGAAFCSTIVGDAADLRAEQREEQLRQVRQEQQRESRANAGPQKTGGERIQRMWTRIDLDEED
jgi:hypothetical protein